MKRTLVLAALVASFILATAPAFGQEEGEDRIQEQGGTAYVPGEVVVAEEGGDYAVREVGAETLGAIKEKAEEIEAEKDVRTAGPNYAYEPSFVPNDPLFERQYNLFRMRSRGAWEYSRGGGVTIGFVDTGYSRTHPELGAKVRGEHDFGRTMMSRRTPATTALPSWAWRQRRPTMQRGSLLRGSTLAS